MKGVLTGDMEENKQIDQKLQQETAEQNEVPVIDKDSVDILDLLETASSWLVSPEDKEAEKKFNEIKNQIIVKSFLPLTMKNALVKKAIFDLRTSDDSIDEFPQALKFRFCSMFFSNIRILNGKMDSKLKTPHFMIFYGRPACAI